ncbi:hypothetical protein TCAL_01629 [Tigriopus californicus]|uniref:Multidrug resistance-associated protein 1 n=1 Tax=Tigriopus californicus TaxID=6832 RepID=A0A553PAF7_TIGCA|nr:multidrug resistance-associated protein 1-like [Tigriopus californicus]TRY74646.1 hypothetical protein TCAL_01629 [Tigriopus californicus]|eukprot:TCALIF_01629-PA protein Name:"Similar to Abcc1 Multidrug resistance-associated protein 1 (Mus musculus)" AED:0.01 eAED:0.01 QI:687/0.66/0.5/1/1/1/4/0/1625
MAALGTDDEPSTNMADSLSPNASQMASTTLAPPYVWNGDEEEQAHGVIYWPELCGSDRPFWNTSQSWHTETPSLSACFRTCVWSVPPFVYFWLFLPFYIRYVRRAKGRDIPLSTLALAKFIVLLALAGVAAMDTAYFALGSSVALVDVMEPLLRLACFTPLLGLLFLERRHGIRVSGFQWCFWTVFLITSALVFYSHLERLWSESLSPGFFPSVTFMLSVFLFVVSFALHFWVEPEPAYRGPLQIVQAQPSPLISASFPSQLAFSWFTGLAWSGFKRSLTFDDLWDLNPLLMSRFVFPRFNRYWERTVKQIQFVHANGHQSANGHGLPDASFNKTQDDVDFKSTKKSSTHPDLSKLSVFPAMVKAFGPAFCYGSVLKFVHDIMVFISPYLLKLIIAFTADTSEPLWKGIFFAFLIFSISCVQTLSLSQYFYKMYVIGLWLRTSLISAIYRKSLRVSTTAKKEITTGEVVNLMSVDVQRIMEMTPYINMLWSAPLQIAGAIFFLWQQLGPSVLAGLLVMVLLVPLNGMIAAKSRTFQILQMKHKDQRVKVMNEILQGMKILKLYAWEPSFEKSVNDIRAQEIKILTQMAYLQSGSSFIWTCAPYVVSLVTFATYVLVDEANVLTAERAFVSLALFNILRFPLSMLPMMITALIQASVSIKRINNYMRATELEEKNVTKDTRPSSQGAKFAVKLNKASFTWNEEASEPTLKEIDVEVKKGSLVAIVGTVGSGKSSLLAAMLGEINRIEGEASINGRVAYVAQQAWIQNETIQNNILFNESLDDKRYKKVIEACALQADLSILTGGDQTEIGEKGINLSGGQKHRVSLARATYCDADIYLMDDPLAAVDSHVGKHIFQEVIGPEGLLAKKTRVLVTHSIAFLPKMDNIVVLKEGQVSEVGSYDELLARKGAFAEFLVQFLTEEEQTESDDDQVRELKHTLEECMGAEELNRHLERARKESECKENSVERSMSVSSRKSSEGHAARSPKSRQASDAHSDSPNLKQEQPNPKKLLSPEKDGTLESATKDKPTPPEASKNKQYLEEKSESGKVQMAVYTYYVKNMGVILFALSVISFSVNQVCSAASSIWLSKWSDESSRANQTGTLSQDVYLGVYGAFGVGQGFTAVFGSLFLYLATLNGAKRLHNLVLANVLKSPMSFFDTTPQGRILNRFGKDIDVLDTTMPMILRGWITCLLAVLSTFAIITYATPMFLLPITVVLGAYYIVQRIYVATSRDLKRLESVSRSPIYSHFGETVSGVQTIRAYNLQEHFIRESENRVDYNQRAGYPSIVANRWLAVRLEVVGNIIIFCSALFAVLGRESLSPGLVGLSVSYALSVTQTLNWFVRMTSEVETNIVAAERLKEYADSPTEAAWTNTAHTPEESWPNSGSIQFEDYCTRYREGLPLVLKDLSFSVKGGERVGIVGRTGAGKSSLTLALFRLIEKVSGRILIDNLDISTLGLHDLRCKLTIIPQDPVLFSGTLRMNLDPFNHHNDEEIWQALSHSNLKTFVSDQLAEGLDHVISEGGGNLSVGQCQLICLARALLRKTKILVLDEATAAIDMETDEIIQKTIRTQFNTCTIITIAHRLNTIMDYDKILVLKNGSREEFDSPQTLLNSKESIFYSMCKEAGLTQ